MINEGLSKGVLGSQLQDVIRMVILRGVQELKRISQKALSEVCSTIAPHPCFLVRRGSKTMSHLEQIQDDLVVLQEDLHHKVVAFSINNLPRFTKYLPNTDCDALHFLLNNKIRVNVYNALRSHGTFARLETFLGSEGCTFTQEEWDTACKEYNDHIKEHCTPEESETIEEKLKAMTESVFKWIQMVQSQDCKASTKSGSSSEKDSTLGDSYERTSAADTGSNYTQ
jgi:hypothetical protein